MPGRLLLCYGAEGITETVAFPGHGPCEQKIYAQAHFLIIPILCWQPIGLSKSAGLLESGS
jgi:hypothetical protein